MTDQRFTLGYAHQLQLLVEQLQDRTISEERFYFELQNIGHSIEAMALRELVRINLASHRPRPEQER